MLDDRWEWIDVSTWGGGQAWVKGRCRHTELHDVIAVDGRRVATLCATCDGAWHEGAPL